MTCFFFFHLCCHYNFKQWPFHNILNFIPHEKSSKILRKHDFAVKCWMFHTGCVFAQVFMYSTVLQDLIKHHKCLFCTLCCLQSWFICLALLPAVLGFWYLIYVVGGRFLPALILLWLLITLPKYELDCGMVWVCHCRFLEDSALH